MEPCMHKPMKEAKVRFASSLLTQSCELASGRRVSVALSFVFENAC